jgi:YVTN family beta-propeller protein
VLANVRVGDNPYDLCYCPGANRVYCANEAGQSLTVIDCAGDSVLATVPAGVCPEYLCYNPRDNKVYAANFSSANVTVVDVATSSVIATVPAHGLPHGIGYDSVYNKVYVTEFDSGAVTVIGGASNQVLKRVPVGGHPHALAVCPSQSRVYVSVDGAVAVVRDSASGIEEPASGERRKADVGSTILSRLPAGMVAFDAMGRRVVNPKSGVYFVRERSAVGGERSVGSCHKVIIQR